MWLKVSQIDGVRPPSAAAPRSGRLAVAVPQAKSAGKERTVLVPAAWSATDYLQVTGEAPRLRQSTPW
ncbi:hypothetical protein GCM10025868_30070 [Angustibacter aerolatus]|uniref:Uncharacterized protein n=1 Tax=Angustibacter aerolatus TaxID=1162965 RepID=A0ABQ6JJ10_9ACTN|nr:hypothetical protein GCM10025868_30070 [Angustibacter aerolatus]